METPHRDTEKGTTLTYPSNNLVLIPAEHQPPRRSGGGDGMSEIEDLGEFDAIVIGTGMAGLMAGNALANSGQRTLMLEKHSNPGGCTMNFERGDYRFEASNHVINGCAPGGMTYRLLERVGAQHQVEFIRLESFGRMIDEGRGTDFSLPWELGAHIEMLVENFPHEEEGIRAYYARFGSMSETLIASHGVVEGGDPSNSLAWPRQGKSTEH